MHKNLMKIGRAVPGICLRTDRQTDIHGHHNTPLSDGGGVIIDAFTFAYYTCHILTTPAVSLVSISRVSDNFATAETELCRNMTMYKMSDDTNRCKCNSY